MNPSGDPWLLHFYTSTFSIYSYSSEEKYPRVNFLILWQAVTISFVILFIRSANIVVYDIHLKEKWNGNTLRDWILKTSGKKFPYQKVLNVPTLFFSHFSLQMQIHTYVTSCNRYWHRDTELHYPIYGRQQ